jgi:hypothetical protein
MGDLVLMEVFRWDAYSYAIYSFWHPTRYSNTGATQIDAKRIQKEKEL